MKTKLFFIIGIAIAVIFSTKAQTIGGQDVNILGKEKKFEMRPKISIANNGWIYILSTYRDGDNTYTGATGYEVKRSKDGGKTYSVVLSKGNNAGWILNDIDMVVTGSKETNINIWIAIVAKCTTGNKQGDVTINRYDANGKNLKSVYHESTNNVRRNYVAISTNFRSPGADTNPFGIAIAVSGYNDNDGGKGFVDFIYSKNAGTSFTKKCVFNEKTDVGRVDVSLGACKSGSSSHTLAGIVFERDFGSKDYGSIGFVSANLNTLKFSDVIIINFGHGTPPYDRQCWYPQIQYMSNKDHDPRVGSSGQYHNFVITYNRLFLETNDIVFVTPKKSFEIATATRNDLNRYNVSEKGYGLFDASLSYNKTYNHYLLTYVAHKMNTVEYELHYRYFRFYEIDKSDSWMTVGDGMYSKTNYIMGGLSYNPAVDINLTNSKAHFAWASRFYNNMNVWTDFENSTLDNPEITISEKEFKVHPNPAIDKVSLELLTHSNCTASLSDLQGREIKSFVFSGTQYALDVSDLPVGVYLLSVKSDNHKHYVRKLIKK